MLLVDVYSIIEEYDAVRFICLLFDIFCGRTRSLLLEVMLICLEHVLAGMVAIKLVNLFFSNLASFFLLLLKIVKPFFCLLQFAEFKILFLIIIQNYIRV